MAKNTVCGKKAAIKETIMLLKYVPVTLIATETAAIMKREAEITAIRL